jgi:hypothetical protein
MLLFEVLGNAGIISVQIAAIGVKVKILDPVAVV